MWCIRVCVRCYLCAAIIEHNHIHWAHSRSEFTDTWMGEAFHLFKQNDKYIEQQTSERTTTTATNNNIAPKKRSAKWCSFFRNKRQFLIEWKTTVYCDDCFISRMESTEGKIETHSAQLSSHNDRTANINKRRRHWCENENVDDRSTADWSITFTCEHWAAPARIARENVKKK